MLLGLATLLCPGTAPPICERSFSLVRLLQPVHQFREMIRGFVGVIAVEKGDAFDVAGDFPARVQITERQTPAAAVASEHNLLPIVREDVAHGVEQRGDAVVAIGASPRGPALERVLQIRDDDGLVREDIAEKPRLRADVLDVEMPVIARLYLFADGLLDGVAVGQCVENEEIGLVGRLSSSLPIRGGGRGLGRSGPGVLISTRTPSGRFNSA